ncbi:hypothetical protein [Flammeovirga pacifica]|uniref:DNA-binding protein n=1 Tax=Flammeovirga pacifica TaxID=915059 RepID=A0A1S1YZA9_FLAPC|nr:hypothetical protein [Flammeovirga pacifica]OHX66351.1 hypothetical protein NH26_08300 [Flammeovirga pacifica]
MKNTFALTLLAFCIITSCDNTSQNNNTKGNTHVNTAQKSEEVLGENTHKVVVKEQMSGGGYLYINVTEDDQEYWMAIPGRPVNIGATYYYDGGMEMQNFQSKTLQRTFERIIFAEGIRDNVSGEVKVENKSTPQGSPQVSKIEKAPNGISIAELFENPKKYENKQVIIKGQVVKVNNGVMNVNFVHLQDGTIGKGEYDVTLTTNDNFKVGEVATIKGGVILNKNFGSGYVYDVLIENAVKK